MNMGEWSFLVPPDITITLRARSKPALLARCLGDEVTPSGQTDVLLDFTTLGPAGSGMLRTDRYKGITWTCRTGLDGGRYALAWRSPYLREYLALHVAMLPALRRLLLDRDIALVLGAAFEVDGETMVLAGETGTGKTAALLTALDAGARLVGDEYVGIAADGGVTPVLRVLALRRATLAGAPQLRPQLTRRLMLRAAEVAARLSGLRLDPLVHVSPEELGIPVSDSAAQLSRLIWLDRGAKAQPGGEPMDEQQVIDALGHANERHDNAYAVPSSLTLGERGNARWRDVLASGLRNVRCERLTLPKGTLPGGMLRQLIDAEPLARPSA
jgi:hypothetical protein